MHGIDVSNNNGRTSELIDGVSLPGVQFIIAKSTESTTFSDPTYHLWQKRAGDNAIPFGAYHFAHPDQHSAKDEADFFIKMTGGMYGQLRPSLDFETRGSTDPLAIMGVDRAVKWVDEWCDRVSQSCLCDPMFYSFRAYYKLMVPEMSERWGLWLSSMMGMPHYTVYAGRAVSVEQWGIVGGVDQNESYLPIDISSNQSHSPSHPVERDEEMVMLRRKSDGFIALVTDNKWVHLTDLADVWNLAAGGVKYCDNLSDAVFSAMTKALGNPVEP